MNRRWSAAFLLALSILILTAALGSMPGPGAGTVQISFIDAGQGDSALIQDSQGFDVLIDGGKTSAGPTVVAYLRDQGVDDLEVMLVTHADSDHVGGLIAVLEAAGLPVKQVLYNGYPGDTNTWEEFAAAVSSSGLTLTAAQFPQVFSWGETTAHILNPAPGLGEPETNNASVVVRLDHGENSILFTGDIDTSIEATVVARGTPVAAEVLKVGHHGSRYSSGEEFLTAVQPQIAVISVGKNNYGHPAEETLARLQAAGAEVFRTDEAGTLVLVSDGLGYRLYPARGWQVFLPLLVR